MDIFNGTVVNLSEVTLLVAETTSNAGKKDKPNTVVHNLQPGYRTPSNIDADGLKRADGKSIEGHPYWIKFKNPFTAKVTGTSKSLHVDVWFKILGSEDQFGEVELDPDPAWGERLQRVTHVIKKKKKTVGYIIDAVVSTSKDEAIQLHERGFLLNVTLVQTKHGSFLRTLPDHDSSNNLLTVS